MRANGVPQSDRNPRSMCVLIIGSESYRLSLTMACKQAGWEVSAEPGRANAILLDPTLVRWANEPAERIVALVIRARQFAQANRLSPRQTWLVALLSQWGPPCPDDLADPVPVENSIPVVATGNGAANSFLQPPFNYPAILIVYKELASPQRLVFQRWVQDGGGANGWRTPLEVDPSLRGVAANNRSNIVELNGELYLYVVRNDSTVAEYLYDRANSSFSLVGTVQVGGASVRAIEGFAVTAGYEKGYARKIYAVYRPAAGGAVEFLRRDGANAWAALTNTVWSTMPRLSSTFMPGITYVPFDEAVPSEGRFYVHTTNAGCVFGNCISSIFTEGNDPASSTTRRLRFVTSGLGSEAVFQFSQLNGQESLLAVPYAVSVGTRHVAVAGSVTGVAFYPFWDGIFNPGTTDHDDFVTVGRNTACGIKCIPPALTPNPSVADGCCPGGATGPGFDKDCTQNYLRDVAFSGSGDWSATASCRAL